MHTTRSLIAGAGLAAAAVVLTAAPAAAHVAIEETEQTAGAYTVLTFGVPHGCDGSPTTKVEIQIPESILDVTPNRSPFYDVNVETESLPAPVEDAHGGEITEREAVVVYTATEPLPDTFRDALGISLQVPEDAAGETLYFPTLQTCADGETAWIEIPESGQDPHELETPAPAITVIESKGTHGAAGDEDVQNTEVDAAPDGELATSTANDDGTDALTIVALVVAALGLIAGAAGFAIARKATR